MTIDQPAQQTIQFILRDEFIELYKLLKIESVVNSGGEAKNLIASGLVKINGEPDLRKRRKLVAGDMVEAEGTTITICSKEIS